MTDPYVFPTVRDAVRAWVSHRKGGMAGLARQSARGRGPSADDCARVGRVLRNNPGATVEEKHRREREIRELVAWALGAGERTRGAQTAAQRLTRHLRREGLMAESQAKTRLCRYSAPDADGARRSVIVTAGKIILDG